MARDIYSRYARSCEKRRLEPVPAMLECCKSGSSALNLAGNCISVENCRVLAKTLQHGHPFTELDLSDCLMGDEGVCKLLEFLRDDDQITRVSLKGNSIKSLGVQAIADLLKRNITLERLSLEWNNIGLYESDMKQLCEGLSMNTSLRCLDLRSNHIDHVGGGHIASTLIINTTLQELDLRWNNLGVLGGRKLLSALRSNNSIVRMQLEGNNMPQDITDAIGTTLSLRVSHQLLEAQHQVESMQLSAQLSQIQTDSQQKVMEVLDTLDSERVAFLQTTQLSQCEIADLKSHLEERDTTIARLESKLLEVQSALRTNISKSEDLSRNLEEVTSQASEQEQALKLRIEELEREVVGVTEQGRRESISASGRERTAQTKIHSLELEVQIVKGNLSTTNQDWEVVKSDLKSRISDMEAHLSEQESHHKSEIKTLREKHQKELLLQVEESKAREATLARKAQGSDESVMKLEKALQSSRVQCEEERGKSAEEVERLQQTIKLQTMKTSHMQDQLEELKATHRSTAETLRSTISQQQTEKARLEEQCEALQQKLKVAHQELEGERSEKERARKSHKAELKELAEERDTLVTETRQLKKNLEQEKKKNDEAKSKRESELGMLRSEKAELKQKVEQQRATIQRFQQDEQQRLSQLKAALNTYFSSTPKLSETDIM